MRMKELPSAARLRECLDYDPETGSFRWRETLGGKGRNGGIAGYRRANGRLTITVDGGKYRAARLAWVIVNGRIPPGVEIDHKNGDSGDDRIENLRLATHAQNATNRQRNFAGALPRGVVQNRAKFSARIKSDGHLTHLGTFATPQEAHWAFAAAARAAKGDFARTD